MSGLQFGSPWNDCFGVLALAVLSEAVLAFPSRHHCAHIEKDGRRLVTGISTSTCAVAARTIIILGSSEGLPRQCDHSREQSFVTHNGSWLFHILDLLCAGGALLSVVRPLNSTPGHGCRPSLVCRGRATFVCGFWCLLLSAKPCPACYAPLSACLCWGSHYAVVGVAAQFMPPRERSPLLQWVEWSHGLYQRTAVADTLVVSSGCRVPIIPVPFELAHVFELHCVIAGVFLGRRFSN